MLNTRERINFIINILISLFLNSFSAWPLTLSLRLNEEAQEDSKLYLSFLHYYFLPFFDFCFYWCWHYLNWVFLMIPTYFWVLSKMALKLRSFYWLSDLFWTKQLNCWFIFIQHFSTRPFKFVIRYIEWLNFEEGLSNTISI
mgnify:CR=1 FL=1